MADAEAVAEYLRRSYFAADGLWFVQAEEAHGFEEALRLDVAVWRVLGKIQARKAREVLGIEGGAPADLVAALGLKFEAEQYDHRAVRVEPERAEIEIRGCPWIELLRKSGRMHLAARVADAICETDCAAWAREFDPALAVEMPQRMCSGDEMCRIVFRRDAAGDTSQKET